MTQSLEEYAKQLAGQSESDPLEEFAKTQVELQQEQPQEEQSAYVRKPLQPGPVIEGEQKDPLQTEDERKVRFNQFVANTNKMDLGRKIKVREEFRQSLTKQAKDQMRVVGQTEDDLLATYQAESYLDKLLPINDQEKETEKNVLHQQRLEKQVHEDELLSAKERGPTYNVVRGAFRDTANMVQASGELLDTINRKADKGLRWLSGNEIRLSTDIVGDKDEGTLTSIGKFAGELVDYGIPPSRGEIRGDLGDKVFEATGGLLALGGLAKGIRFVAGANTAKATMIGGLAAIGGKGAADQIEQEALSHLILNGMPETVAQEEAKRLGDNARLIMTPISGVLAELSPLSRIAEGRTIARSFPTRFVVGGLAQGVEQGAQQAMTEALPYLPKVFDLKNLEEENVAQSFANVREAALIGLLSGGTVAAALGPSHDKVARARLLQLLGKDIDSVGRDEFRRVMRDEFKLPPDEAKAVTKALDEAIRAIGKESTSPEQFHKAMDGVYLGLIANRSLRDMPGMIKMNQPERSAELYSELRRKVIDEKFSKAFPNGGDGEQVLAYLKNQPGIKADELSWTETDQFLREMRESGKKVTQDDLLKHLHENELTVVQFIKGGPEAVKLKKLQADATKNLKDNLEADDYLGFETFTEAWNAISRHPDWQQRWEVSKGTIAAVEQHRQMQEATKAAEKGIQTDYATITPSGPSTNYEEWLLKVPNLRRTQQPTAQNMLGERLAIGQTRKLTVTYQPPHFGPEARNTIVHIRLDERLIGGVKTLMVHEVQSDWHQTGHEEGYQPGNADERIALQDKYIELDKKEKALEQERSDLSVEFLDKIGIHWGVLWGEGEFSSQRRTSRLPEVAALKASPEWKTALEIHDRILKNEETHSKLITEMSNLSNLAEGHAGVPKGPFSKTWTHLAWKKILLEASNRGYEQIAWAPGELQDKFQGDPGEEARVGRKVYYNKITPQVVKELLKGRGWKGEVAVGELSTEKDLDQGNVGIEQTHDGKFIIKDFIDGTVLAGPFRTSEEAQQHINAKLNLSTGKEPVFTIPLPEPVRQRINLEGFPLFQQPVRPRVLQDVVKPKQEVKAIQLKSGKFLIGDTYDQHLDMMIQNKIKADDVESSGIIMKVGEKFMYQGTDAHVSFYKAELEGGKPIEVTNPSSVNLLVDPTKAEVLPRKQEGELGRTERGRIMSQFRGTEFFQGNRASVEFLDTMQAVMRGLENPDVSSTIHEVGHILRQSLLPEHYLKQIENWIGVKDGMWTLENEEKFAKAFEQYFLNNRPPSGDLTGAFKTISDQMKAIYKSIDSGPLGERLPESMHQAFDAVFMRERETIESKRKPVLELEQKIKVLDLKTEQGKLDAVKLGEELKVSQAALEREQQLSLNWRLETRPERLAKEAAEFPPADLGSLPDRQWGLVKTISRAGHELASWGSLAALLSNTTTGRRFNGLMDSYFAEVRGQIGQFEPVLAEVFDALKPSDKRFLRQVNPKTGQSMIRELIDKISSVDTTKEPLTLEQKTFVNFFKETLAKLDKNAELLQVLRRLPSGDSVPFQKGLDTRLPLILTNDGYHIIESGGGAEFDALINKIQELNPDIKLDTIKREFEAYKNQSLTRPFGMLEFSRTIKYWPDVIDVNGGKVAVFHYEPYTLLNRVIDRTVHRQAFINTFGQGILKNVASPGKEGYISRLKNVAKIFDERTAKSVEEIKTELVSEFGFTPESVEKLKRNELQVAAKGLTSFELDEGVLLQTLLGKTAGDIKNVSKQKELRAIASEVGGIDSKGQIADVWNEVKRRLTTVVEDDLVKFWRNNVAKEGGRVDDFDKVLRVVQGIPLYDMDMTRVLNRMSAAALDTLGATVTTMSVWKNIPQTLRTIHKAGFLQSARAFYDVLTNYHEAEQAAMIAGAANDVRFFQRPETRYASLMASHYIREAAGIVGGMGPMAQFLNVFAAQAGRRLAESWKNGRFGKLDMQDARALRLSEDEVNLLQKTNGSGMTDLIYKKIVQNVGNGSQFVLENPHRKGSLEQSPYMKRIFAFNSYTMGSARDLVHFVDSLKATVKTGDQVQILGAGKAFLRWTAVMLGNGFVTAALYEKIKGAAAKPDDDKWWEEVLSASFESGMFGVPSRWLTPVSYQAGYERWLLGNVPIVNTIGSTIFMLAGLAGKESKLPLEERGKAAAKRTVPLISALTNWWERENNLPKVQAEEVRNKVRSWEKTQPGYKEGVVTVTPFDPEYYPVYEAVSRYDLEDSVKETQQYLRNAISKGELGRHAVTRLRASLMSRRPLNLSIQNMPRFLNSMKEEDRVRAVMLQYQYMNIVNRIVPVSLH